MSERDVGTATIRCEACLGTGLLMEDRGAAICVSFRVPCPLCNGTGREPATVTPKHENSEERK